MTRERGSPIQTNFDTLPGNVLLDSQFLKTFWKNEERKWSFCMGRLGRVHSVNACRS